MFLLSLLARLPLRLLYGVSSLLAFLAHRVLRYRLRVARHNIDLCFPSLSEGERRRVVRDFYHHLADVAVEAIWFGGCCGQRRGRLREQHIVEIANPEVVAQLAAGGRSMVILSSHAGNWELSGGILHYNYKTPATPFSEQNYIVVYKALNSKNWDAFMRRNRTAPLDDPEGFEGCLESREVLRYIVKHRDEQKFYNFITDQRPYRFAQGNVPVTFLGQEVQSMVAAAHLAQRFACSVVYQRMRRVSRGHYTLEYVPISADASATTPQAIMDRYYELLSADIQAQPALYLWTHKRFQ